MVLELLTVGAFVAGSLVAPGLAGLSKGKNINFESIFTEDEWDVFDQGRLKQKLKALHKQKIVKFYKEGDRVIVQLTDRGRRKQMKYNLDDLEITKPNKWDKRWRIVAYDIPENKKYASKTMRQTLQRLGFYQLQKSVYLYPYPCNDVVEFLRQIYDIDEYVTYLTIGYLENEEVYKDYFDI